MGFFRDVNRISRKIYGFLERRIVSEMYYYPGEIRRAAKGCVGSKKQFKWVPPEYKAKNIDIDGGSRVWQEMKLAGTSLPHERGGVPWEHKFEDKEDAMSLHRWNWLLTAITEQGISDKLISRSQNILEDWVLKHMEKKKGVIWGAYTTGERICNSSIFYWLAGQVPPETVLNAMGDFAEHLVGHLEYRGNYTNNHILNNARALYFAGSFLDVEEWRKLARLIFRRELRILVTEDGFLREGSSHYQFLFTRWVLEVIWLARENGDRDFCGELESFAGKLLRRCWFFLVWNSDKEEWTMPLFGDVSPDFSPEWLRDVPRSGIALSIFHPDRPFTGAPLRGWAKLFEPGEGNIVKRGLELKQDTGGTEHGFFGNSGWYRVDSGDITLFVRAEPEGIPGHSTHSHNDTGSFCAYVKGFPVIIDCGRLDYTGRSFSRYGISPLSHNTVLIDGYGSFPLSYKREVFDVSFWSEKSSVKIFKIGSGWNIVLKISGFNQPPRKEVTMTRTLHVRENAVEIEDIFEGKGVRNIETRFHFAPDIRFKETDKVNTYCMDGEFGTGKFAVYSPPNTGKRALRGDDADMGGWYSPAYGEKEVTTTFSVKSGITLPAKTSYRFYRD